MADQAPDPKQDPKTDPTDEDREKAFFDKMGGQFETVLDKWFDKKREEFRGTGTSRSGGRATLPGILADLVFGPEKKSS